MTTHPTLARGRRLRLLAVYRTVLRVLLSYGVFAVWKRLRGEGWAKEALPRLHQANARRVLATILSVQGLFIKVGQLISVLSNVLPADFRHGLEGLQDRIPPRPWEEIAGVLRSELGERLDRGFAGIDHQALAAASLAQVHAATLPDGRRVAVKVQHLEIEELARVDLETVGRVLGIVRFFLGLQGLDTLLAEVGQMIREELDFSREAENLEAIAAGFADDPQIGFPQVVHELSTSRVLVTSFVEGTKISDLAALDAKGIDRPALAERLLRAYCRMIFTAGLFHADPHPGNLLVEADGRIVFLDFGAVGRLSPKMKEGIPQLIEAVLRRDRRAILQGLERMGFVQRQPDEDVAERVIDAFYQRFLAHLELDSWNLADLRFDLQEKVELAADLRRLDVSLRDLTGTFTVPREWILLERTLLLLVGVCTELDPAMRPLAVVRPYLKEFVLGPDRDWMAFVRSAMKDFATTALTLPGELSRVLAKVDRGEAQVEVRGLRESAILLYAVAHQLLYGGFALATGVLAYVARARGDEAFVLPLAATSAVFLLCLAVSLWRARRLGRSLRRMGKG